MRWHSVPLVVAIILALTLEALCQADQTSPVILIYCGETPDWGNRLSQLIEEDGRFDADVQVIQDRTTYETVVNFPRIQALVICPLEKERIALGDVSNLTAAYLLDGGAVVGIGAACTSRYAPHLGPKVFGISGNRSIPSLRLADRRVFAYYRKEVIDEINGDLPATTLHMEGYLAFYSANQQGEYVEIPADGTRHILYEGEKGAPLVIAFESASGGASIAFPGLTVQVVEGKDNFYGHLFEREEFKQLFLNGLRWAIDHSSRFERLREVSGQALEDEANRRADLADEADRLERRIEARRLGRLAILWGIGIAFSAAVALKLVLVRG